MRPAPVAPRLARRGPIAMPVVCALLALAAAAAAPACTNFVAGPKATTDGSVIVTYTCDGEFHPRLERIPAADHEKGAMQQITGWGGQLMGEIPYPPHTYGVVNLMNDHQVSIAETTTGGRDELINPDGLLHYWQLMRLTLQRAATAREAVEVMGRLVAEHGYRSSGESYCIGDPREAWIMEMVGPGPGGKGAFWVAIRLPDDAVSAFANSGRIGEIPTDMGDRCLHSDLKEMAAFAAAQGWYDPAAGPFSWREAFHPADAAKRRYTETRVWSLLRRAAPSRDWPVDYHRGDPDAEPYPLWIKPDHKLGVADVFALMRDHYEGTPYDMTEGLDAGPYGDPRRWRPMGWELDGQSYSWERPISTQQTGFSMVCQSRAWLPDPVGGLTWYGLDDTDFTCYTPLYCGIDAIPASFAVGDLGHFSWDDAWWIFNLVSNWSALRYSAMIQDVRAVQQDIEGTYLALQPAVEKTAVELAGSDPALATRYLTDYSVQHAEALVGRWRDLAESLLVKYNDGYVKDEKGRPQEVGYPEGWLRAVQQAHPEKYLLPQQGPSEQPKDY